MTSPGRNGHLATDVREAAAGLGKRMVNGRAIANSNWCYANGVRRSNHMKNIRTMSW